MAAGTLSVEGMPSPALDGKLLRPLTAYLMVPTELRPSLDRRFWFGALAVEMVHEASLLHDDILDEAPQRRGKPTMVAAAGVGPALVLGDHLLTAAYRAAAAAECPGFLQAFIRSVERTVAGEIAQEESQGQALNEEDYYRKITGKSGELFRSAFTLPSTFLGIGDPEGVGALGARFGRLYQMVDDFLDYCPSADRGKVPLQDYRQKKWTWPLDLIGVRDFERPEPEILLLLFGQPGENGLTPMEDGVHRIRAHSSELIRELGAAGMETFLLNELLRGWVGGLRKAASVEVLLRSERALMDSTEGRGTVEFPISRGPEIPSVRPGTLRRELREAAACLASPEERLAFFGRHAKTFRFASRLFPEAALRRVAGVYAFCRFTDDLVDEAEETDLTLVEGRLHTWMILAREAYDGGLTGIALLDDVMGEMRESGVPFLYVEELGRGVRMDLTTGGYETLEELRTYSYRVASVVGGWLTELFGVQDPWVLERAFALGHAMQLTNILRDVGEDLHRGRIYLPQRLMETHGVDRELLEATAKNRGRTSPGYRRLVATLMSKADADYERAFQAIPTLPRFFQGPVAVAAKVYQGIHDEIRRNAYDNLSRRARTTLWRKLLLGVKGLLALRRARKRIAEVRVNDQVRSSGFSRNEATEAAR